MIATEEENIFERISKVKNNDKKTITRIANSKIFYVVISIIISFFALDVCH